MDVIGGIIGISIAWWFAVLVLAGLAFPIFWIWMLVDSILRSETDYPDGTPNEKLVWVLLIALAQIAAVFYFFMVYRKANVSCTRATTSCA